MSEAEQFAIVAYGSVVLFTFYVYEWLLCVNEEVEMCKRMRISIPVIMYYLSRLSTLVFTIASLIASASLQLQLLPHFAPRPLWWINITKVLMVTSYTSLAPTSLLFFVRVWAIFSRSRMAQCLFTAMWAFTGIAPLALIWSETGPKCGTGLTVGKSFDTCLQNSVYMLFLFLLLVFHNTVVFVCVSRRLRYGAMGRRRYFRTYITGEGLQVVSRSLLRTGQLYYVVTMILIVIIAVSFWGQQDFFIKTSGFIPALYLIISSLLTCRVFRMLLLCTFDAEQSLGVRSADTEVIVLSSLPRAKTAYV